MLARDKHSSLLETFINYGRKKFNNIDPGIFFVFSFTLSVSYSDSPTKKKFYNGGNTRTAMIEK
jgi:hypothetical protein